MAVSSRLPRPRAATSLAASALACLLVAPTLASQTAAESPAWAPLPPGYVFRDDPAATIANLDPGLPESWKIALETVNLVRAESGLPALRYDASLTGMGMAHVNYVLLNAKRGVATRGHYEDPKLPGYTKEGDEAARTSGLSGGRTPLEGLRALLDAPFHRDQFLGQGAGRIGMGFGFDPSTGASMCLFVIRYDPDPPKGERFQPFPAPGSESFSPTFELEWPEPRPIRYPKGKPPVTGGIASLAMDERDARAMESCEAELLDASGTPVDSWTSSPVEPVPGALPSDSGSVYSGDTSDVAAGIRLNFLQVHIMPKRPLAPGAWYTARVRMRIAGKDVETSWSFRIAPPTAHRVLAGLPPDDPRSWDYAVSVARTGDAIFLSSGEHRLSSQTYLARDLAIRGAGAEGTLVRFSKAPKEACWLYATETELSVGDLSFTGDGALVYAAAGSRVSLERISARDVSSAVVFAADGGTATVVDSSFVRVGRADSPPFHAFANPGSKEKGRVTLGSGCTFAELRSSSRQFVASEAGRTWIVEEGGTLALADALLLAPAGETVLVRGRHVARAGFFADSDLVIQGDGATIELALPPDDVYVKAYGAARIVVRGVRFSGNARAGYARDTASLHFEDCAFFGANEGMFAAIVDGRASTRFERCDFSAWGSTWIVWLATSGASYSASGCLFPAGSVPQVWRNGKAEAFVQK